MKMRIKSSMVSTALCLSLARLTIQGVHSWGSNKSTLNCGRPGQVIEWLLFFIQLQPNLFFHSCHRGLSLLSLGGSQG